ncbi:ureidoglycolate hydrolase [Methylobacterium terrae]|uniref:Ureidoglycolate hydrolase n=1 Tax=Methylobacterium terrae TaxID=2202827 RepID=A0A2U8WIM5_9HYPH|nr:ureidoglycolate lyase [Methylobacterium terrae]AWN45371.1 ureidoglycolate hydrolase [Methylobacterium terrae]
MRTLPIAPITAEAFAPYGTLLVGPSAGPRQDRAAEIDNGRPGVALNLALVRSEPFAATMPLRRLERHPHSAQAFLPLAAGDYLVVVAPDTGGRPDEAALRAFRVPAGTGIVYRRGAWHAHMTTMAAPGTFAMLVHEDGSPEDCVFAPISPVTPEA